MVSSTLKFPAGPHAKPTKPDIDRDSSESRCREQGRHRCGTYWYERAVPVNPTLQPSVLDFKRQKDPARFQDAPNFGERPILQLARLQVM